ncbi:MAG: efflux RND transporter periplasmic adaptor subunit, partial [Tepidisphaeraceae bacterium]
MAKRALAPGVLVGLFALLTVAGCEGGAPAGDAAPGKKEPEAVPVILRQVKSEPIQRYVEVVGTLWGDEDATVSAKVAGRVVGIFKDVGDRAAPDEPLAHIEQTDYELAARQKELAVSEQLAKLGLGEFPAGDFDANTVPTVQRAKLQADNAQAKYQRGLQLHEQTPPLISDQDFADLRTAWDVAKSNYDVEMLTARSLLSEARTRQAELQIARQALADTTVKTPSAPSPGTPGEGGSEDDFERRATTNPNHPNPLPKYRQRGQEEVTTSPSSSPREYAVAARQVSVGEYVSQGTPLFRLIDDDPLKYRAAVPERFAADIRVGQGVRLVVEAFAGREFAGEVTRINPQIDPANRTFQIECIIPNPQRVLKPGAFARARLLTHSDSGVVFVPREAVVTFAGTTKVFTVDPEGKAVEQTIQTGERK